LAAPAAEGRSTDAIHLRDPPRDPPTRSTDAIHPAIHRRDPPTRSTYGSPLMPARTRLRPKLGFGRSFALTGPPTHSCVDQAGAGDPRGNPAGAGDPRGNPAGAGDPRGNPAGAGDPRGKPAGAGDPARQPGRCW
jgi:hypothetical protein